jgi:hypothetical protein
VKRGPRLDRTHHRRRAVSSRTAARCTPTRRARRRVSLALVTSRPTTRANGALFAVTRRCRHVGADLGLPRMSVARCPLRRRHRPHDSRAARTVRHDPPGRPRLSADHHGAAGRSREVVERAGAVLVRTWDRWLDPSHLADTPIEAGFVDSAETSTARARAAAQAELIHLRRIRTSSLRTERVSRIGSPNARRMREILCSRVIGRQRSTCSCNGPESGAGAPSNGGTLGRRHRFGPSTDRRCREWLRCRCRGLPPDSWRSGDR